MVQVDIFWSYGLSAGLALAGRKIIKKSPTWWSNEAFIWTVLWTACVFAPSGIYLLWTNPGWETMFVARDFASLPPWLVSLFCLTNITQGVLGFYVTACFIRKDQWQKAVLQPIWSHVMMFAILIFGWDGTGYKRFFYAGTGAEWQEGKIFSIADFFSSSIFYALLSLGVIFIPSYFYLIKRLSKAQ